MRHVPVLLHETIDALHLLPNMKVIDCTLGDAGHSDAILQQISPQGKLLGIDTDPEAVLRAKQFLYPYEERVVFARDNFANLQNIATQQGFSGCDAILMDLGWSTPQFEQRGRGLSFQRDEPLDMRYSGSLEADKRLARDIVNNETEEQLEYIFRTYGEENLSPEIAAAIVQKREEKAVETTGELVEVILEAYRTKLNSKKEIPWIGGLHPATKVFQALRIAVNKELEVLEQALPQAVEVLKSGGRLAVITFHSLEDRIVKHYFKSQENKTLKILSRKPITCNEEEYKNNAPSRSAKLRVIQKI